MPGILLLIIAFLEVAAASAPEPWRNDEPCGQAAAPIETASREDCPDAHCVRTKSDVEICGCRGPEPDMVFIDVRAGGRRVQRYWYGLASPVTSANFQVLEADLDGRGGDEVIIATLNAVSNGMAVEAWTVCVIPGDSLESPRVCAQLKDFGRMGFLTRPTGDATCLLLHTQWRNGTEPGRGDGLYLVGRWLRYGRDRFRDEPSRPLVARRFLSSFDKERSEATGPLLWFRDALARAVSCPDPLCER